MNLEKLGINANGLKIQFESDLVYETNINNIIRGNVGGMFINGQWLDDLRTEDSIKDKLEILRLKGFIKDDEVIIPKDSIAIINDVDCNLCCMLKIDDLNFSIFLPYLVTEESELNDETILVKII